MGHVASALVNHGKSYAWKNKGKLIALGTTVVGTNLLGVVSSVNGIRNNPFRGPAKPAPTQTVVVPGPTVTETVPGPTVTAAPVTHTVTEHRTITDPGVTTTRTLIDPSSTATVTHTVTAFRGPDSAANLVPKKPENTSAVSLGGKGSGKLSDVD